MFAAVPPTCEAPSCVPFHDASLNDLSSSVPTSVTMPIFRALAPLAAGVPVEQAPATIANPASRINDNDRVRMCPPLVFETDGRFTQGPSRSRATHPPRGRSGAHPTDGWVAGQATAGPPTPSVAP